MAKRMAPKLAITSNDVVTIEFDGPLDRSPCDSSAQLEAGPGTLNFLQPKTNTDCQYCAVNLRLANLNH